MKFWTVTFFNKAGNVIFWDDVPASNFIEAQQTLFDTYKTLQLRDEALIHHVTCCIAES
jgi:hypothetical protein